VLDESGMCSTFRKDESSDRRFSVGQLESKMQVYEAALSMFWCWRTFDTILRAFAKLRKATISFVISYRMELFGSRWLGFLESSYSIIFRKTTEKILESLNSDKNNGHFL
jgi:hypothetical protein